MTHIMSVQAKRQKDGTIDFWFVAMAGEEGPRIFLDDGLAQSAINVLQKVIDGAAIATSDRKPAIS